MKKLRASKDLRDATLARQLVALEKALEAVRKGGWEKDLQREVEEASALLEKVSNMWWERESECRLGRRRKIQNNCHSFAISGPISQIQY